MMNRPTSRNLKTDTDMIGRPEFGGSSKKINTNRKFTTFSNKGVYFFTLLISMIVLLLFYIGQIIFSSIILSTLVSKTNKIRMLF